MTFVSDLSKVRITRQKKTNKALAELLCHTEGLEDRDLKPYLNFKAFDRLADLYDTDREDLYCNHYQHEESHEYQSLIFLEFHPNQTN